MPITVVASIDPDLLENFIYMEKIDVDSVDDCADESMMNFLPTHKNATCLPQPSSSRPKC
jgi:hypothetical protein